MPPVTFKPARKERGPYVSKRPQLTYEHKRFLAIAAHEDLTSLDKPPPNRNAFLGKKMTLYCTARGWPSPVLDKTAGRIYDAFNSGKLQQGLHRESKRPSVQRYPDLEDALYTWFMSYSPYTDISTNIIHAKALEIYKRLHPDKNEFRASTTFVKNFTARHSIEFKEGGTNENGDAAGPGGSNLVQTDPMPHLRHELIGYPLERIFNMNECALFYNESIKKAVPTIDKPGAKKKAKERLSVTVCVNADGSKKIKCWVLGKSKNPRCFNNNEKNQSNEYTEYKSNAKGWMRSDLYWKYILWLRGQIGPDPAVLIVDNCPAHASMRGTSSRVHVQEAGSLKILYLPKNMTAGFLQPCDQGIIKTIKTNYRHYICQRKQAALQALEQKYGDVHDVPVDQMRKLSRFNIRDACVVLSQAWQDVDPMTVKDCWKKSRLLPQYENIQFDTSAVIDHELPSKDLKQDVTYFRSQNARHISALLHVCDTLNADSTAREPPLELPENEDAAMNLLMNNYWSNNEDQYLATFGHPFPSSAPEESDDDDGDSAIGVPSYRKLRGALCQLQLDLMEAGIPTTAYCDRTLAELKVSLDEYVNVFEPPVQSNITDYFAQQKNDEIVTFDSEGEETLFEGPAFI